MNKIRYMIQYYLGQAVAVAVIVGLAAPIFILQLLGFGRHIEPIGRWIIFKAERLRRRISYGHW